MLSRAKRRHSSRQRQRSGVCVFVTNVLCARAESHRTLAEHVSAYSPSHDSGKIIACRGAWISRSVWSCLCLLSACVVLTGSLLHARVNPQSRLPLCHWSTEVTRERGALSRRLLLAQQELALNQDFFARTIGARARGEVKSERDADAAAGRQDEWESTAKRQHESGKRDVTEGGVRGDSPMSEAWSEYQERARQRERERERLLRSPPSLASVSPHGSHRREPLEPPVSRPRAETTDKTPSAVLIQRERVWEREQERERDRARTRAATRSLFWDGVASVAGSGGQGESLLDQGGWGEEQWAVRQGQRYQRETPSLPLAD